MNHQFKQLYNSVLPTAQYSTNNMADDVKVEEKYIAEVEMLDSGDRLRIDQVCTYLPYTWCCVVIIANSPCPWVYVQPKSMNNPVCSLSQLPP